MSSGAQPSVGEVVPPTLFIDRDTCSRKLEAALFAASIPFVAHYQHFARDAPDTEWLAVAGARNWVVVTRDKAIRRRPNEIAAVRRARVHVFALTSGNLSAADTAAIIVAAWPNIRRAVVQIEPPQLWRIERSGRVIAVKA